jgi:hypothetical protein
MRVRKVALGDELMRKEFLGVVLLQGHFLNAFRVCQVTVGGNYP